MNDFFAFDNYPVTCLICNNFILGWNGRKMLIKCPDKLNDAGYLTILKIMKKNFWTCFFNKIKPLCKIRRLSKVFSQDRDLKVLEWPAYSPGLNLIENLWAYLKQWLRKDSFLGKIGKEGPKFGKLWTQMSLENCVKIVRNVFWTMKKLKL